MAIHVAINILIKYTTHYIITAGWLNSRGITYWYSRRPVVCMHAGRQNIDL